MDQQTAQHFEQILRQDVNERNEGYYYLIALTNEPVNWAYAVWDKLLDLTVAGDNHQRSIAAQLLANLSKSDPEKRMEKDLETVLKVARDEKFVTARHALQSLWKIAIVDQNLLIAVTEHLITRFDHAMEEKNGTLIRYDIIEVFRKIYDQIQDANVSRIALELIEKEEDLKYRKKYSGLWKDLINPKKTNAHLHEQAGDPKMKSKSAPQPDIFGTPRPIFEYYPVLVPDDETLARLSAINTLLIEHGVPTGPLVKFPHISIDGVKIQEDDERIIQTLKDFVAIRQPVPVEFGQVTHFPGNFKLTVYLPVTDGSRIISFDQEMMAALLGRPTKLKLHLSLARYLLPAHFPFFLNPELSYPTHCFCDKIALLKKEIGTKGAFKNILTIPFGV
jgi:hypothetical protein